MSRLIEQERVDGRYIPGSVCGVLRRDELGFGLSFQLPGTGGRIRLFVDLEQAKVLVRQMGTEIERVDQGDIKPQVSPAQAGSAGGNHPHVAERDWAWAGDTSPACGIGGGA